MDNMTSEMIFDPACTNPIRLSAELRGAFFWNHASRRCAVCATCLDYSLFSIQHECERCIIGKFVMSSNCPCIRRTMGDSAIRACISANPQTVLAALRICFQLEKSNIRNALLVHSDILDFQGICQYIEDAMSAEDSTFERDSELVETIYALGNPVIKPAKR